MIDKLLEYLPTALAIVGAASVAVRAIAPITATKLDDKLAGVISKVHSLLSKLALNPKS